MPDIIDQIEYIETLRQRIEEHGKLSPEILRRIENRFRLECNYYSNRQEGGTLTREETRTVMIGNISVDNKPLKDILEMKGHDAAMTQILRIGRGEINISEKRIKDIHREIIHEENPEKQKLVGEWKEDYNEIINSKGEKYSFTPPDELPEAMHQLHNWLGSELDKIKRKDKKALSPLIVAFDFHVRFLAIHPFYDGNGRTGRILSNLILVAHGYPPFYITDEEKDTYNRYLTDIQSYGGNPDLFYEFMIGLVARSMQLILNVIEGRDENDPEGWMEKLRLMKTNLPKNPSLQVIRSKESVSEIAEKSIFPVIETLIKQLKVFDELFANRIMWFGVDNGAVSVEIMEHVRKVMADNQPRSLITFKYTLNGFKKAPLIPFDISIELRWRLDQYTYSFGFGGYEDSPGFTQYYHEHYSREEVNTISSQCGDLLVKQIENNLERLKPG